jgi:hypothetical protein
VTARAVAEIEGGKALRKSLRAAGYDLTDLKIVHGQAAATAAGEVRGRVPEVSGALKATIRSAGTKTAGIVRAGNNSRVKYAGPIHWGWPDRNIPANPFASEGAQASEPRWLPHYQRYVDAALDKVKGT